MARHEEDLKLVTRMLSGDERAFDLFGERCFQAVYRFTLARLRGDREVAQEIVQTAMVKALARLETYRGDSSLVTWLCACCHHEMLMHFRREKSTRPTIALDEEVEMLPGALAGPGAQAESELLAREGVEMVHMTLDQLPEHYSRILELMYIEHVPVREIAARLEIGEKAAESLLTRARAAFRSSYTDLTNSGMFHAGARG